MKDTKSIKRQIRAAEKEMDVLKAKRIKFEYKIKHLKNLQHSVAEANIPINQKLKISITGESPKEQKIQLFRSLFRGRQDVFPKRFESKRTGKSGYQSVCGIEWIRPFSQKPKRKCGECENRNLKPVTNEVVRNHLIGFDPGDRYLKGI